MVGRDFDIVESSRTFDVWSIGAFDNHNIVPIGNDSIKLVLIELRGSFEVNSVGIVIFDWDIIFAGFEIGTKRAT